MVNSQPKNTPQTLYCIFCVFQPVRETKKEEEDTEDETKKQADPELTQIINLCKGILQTGEEDQAKEKAELEKIENEQKLATQYDLHWKMKEQCIYMLGMELYNKIYQCLKRSKEKDTDFSTIQNEIKVLVGGDKEKMNKAFLIDQIIECEKNKTYFF